jgi:hypothetical protein
MSTLKPDSTSVEPGKGSKRGPLWLGLALLFVFSFGLRIHGVGHGLPRNYVPDTHIVRSALGMAKDKNVVPPVGKYSTYPNLLPYCLLPLYGAHFGLGRLKGDWGSTQEYADYIQANPAPVHRIARWLTVLFGALTPLAILLAARAMGLGKGAWFAAWFAATGLMNVHFSVQERPWVPMVFFAALAAWPAALYVREPRNRRLLLCGVCAGLAASCHQSGLLVLGLPGLAWLVSPLGWSAAQLVQRLKQGVFCVLAFFLVALLLGYPSYLVHGIPSSAQTIGGDQADASVGGQSINFARQWSTFPHLARGFFGYGPVLSLFALAGLLPFLRRRAALPAGLFALGWGAFFMTHSNDHIRYTLPLAALACFPAGLFVEQLSRRGRAVLAGAALLSLLPLVQSLRLGTLLSRADTRVEGEAWLAQLPEGARVLIDRYGPVVEQDRDSLELLLGLRQASGSSLYNREAKRLQGLLAGDLSGGIDAVYASDLMEIDELAGTIGLRSGLEELCGAHPEDAVTALGVTHMLLVNRYRSGLEGNLLRGLGATGVAFRSLSPASAGDVEVRLPMELEFALTSLWKVERPGPWLGLYELP